MITLLIYIAWALAIYIVLGLGLYVYAVFQTYQILEFWDFSISKDYIGLCPYPYWTLFWLEWIYRKIDRVRK